MIQEPGITKKCDYCGAILDAKSPRKRFCNDICRIYFKRKNIDKNYSQRKKKKAPSDLVFNPAVKQQNKEQEELSSAIIFSPQNPNVFDSKKTVELVGDEPRQSIEAIPRTIQELKAMCPKSITGIERTMWIDEYKSKYNL